MPKLQKGAQHRIYMLTGESEPEYRGAGQTLTFELPVLGVQSSGTLGTLGGRFQAVQPLEVCWHFGAALIENQHLH